MTELFKKVFQVRYIRFLFAGGINALFGYIVFALLMYLVRNKEIALTISLPIAIFFNYMTSSRFVFKDKEDHFKRVAKFYVTYFITYPINLLHLYLTVDLWHWNVYFSQLVVLVYLPVINFLLQRKFIFQNKSRNDI